MAGSFRGTRAAGWNLTVTVLVLISLVGCTRTAAPTAASKATAPDSAVNAPAVLVFRPVLQSVPATPGTPPSAGPADAKVLRQSTDPATQRQALSILDCSTNGADPLAAQDDPALPLVTCDQAGETKYLLGPAFLTGSGIRSASASPGQGMPAWLVNVEFDSAGARTWANYTTQHVGEQVAFVLNTTVLSAPSIQEAITGGSTQISGNFTQQQARDLAARLVVAARNTAAPTTTATTPAGGDDLHTWLRQAGFRLATATRYTDSRLGRQVTGEDWIKDDLSLPVVRLTDAPPGEPGYFVVADLAFDPFRPSAVTVTCRLNRQNRDLPGLLDQARMLRDSLTGGSTSVTSRDGVLTCSTG